MQTLKKLPSSVEILDEFEKINEIARGKLNPIEK